MLLLNKVVHGLFVIHQLNPWVSCSTPARKFGPVNLWVPPSSKTEPTQVRHMFGFAYPTPQPPENTLVFFSLLTQFGSVRTTHNREVCRWSYYGYTILLIFMGFL